MTYSKAILELSVAIGYALDAGDPSRDSEWRKESRYKAITLLMSLPSEFEPDPIIISSDDIKKLQERRRGL